MELITLNGFDKAAQIIADELKKYEGLFITADTEKEVRKQRADLNKYRTFVDGSRKAVTKELKSYFEDLMIPIDDRLAKIDKALEEVEQERKDKLMDEITDYFLTLDFKTVEFGKLWDERWLNKTTDWKKEITDKVEAITRDLGIIESTNQGDTVRNAYLETLDLGKALESTKEIEFTKVGRAFIPTDLLNATILTLKNATEEQVAKVTRFIEALGIDYEQVSR